MLRGRGFHPNRSKQVIEIDAVLLDLCVEIPLEQVNQPVVGLL